MKSQIQQMDSIMRKQVNRPHWLQTCKSSNCICSLSLFIKNTYLPAFLNNVLYVSKLLNLNFSAAFSWSNILWLNNAASALHTHFEAQKNIKLCCIHISSANTIVHLWIAIIFSIFLVLIRSDYGAHTSNFVLKN